MKSRLASLRRPALASPPDGGDEPGGRVAPDPQRHRTANREHARPHAAVPDRFVAVNSNAGGDAQASTAVYSRPPRIASDQRLARRLRASPVSGAGRSDVNRRDAGTTTRSPVPAANSGCLPAIARRAARAWRGHRRPRDRRRGRCASERSPLIVELRRICQQAGQSFRSPRTGYVNSARSSANFGRHPPSSMWTRQLVSGLINLEAVDRRAPSRSSAAPPSANRDARRCRIRRAAAHPRPRRAVHRPADTAPRPMPIAT